MSHPIVFFGCSTKRLLSGNARFALATTAHCNPSAFAFGFGAAAFSRFASEGWWAHKGSNLGPLPCEGFAYFLSTTIGSILGRVIMLPAWADAVTQKPPDPADGLVVDVVGPWASEKHERLRKYVDSYRSARAMFLPPKGSGGAAYIELFSGPGRSLVEGSAGIIIDGSPLVAYKAAHQSRTKFSELHLNDLDRDNVDTLRKRISDLGGAGHFYNDRADIAVDHIVYALNPAGLHFAFLDPYNLESLPFSIVEKLSTRPRMDMLSH